MSRDNLRSHRTTGWDGEGYCLKYPQGWVWCSLQLQYHQPLNISYVQACYRHHEASWARLGSMTVSFEAVPHSPSSGVAQPQSSMKESYPAKVHLQEVDQTATASSTSNKSTSLQLLLLLHTMAGIAALRHRNEGPCSSRSHTATRAAGRSLTCARVMAMLVSWWSPPAPAARRASGSFASSETLGRTL